MERGGGLTSWGYILSKLRKRFDASIYDDPLGRISKLVQTSTEAKFSAEFEELMTRITGVTEHMFMNSFLWGLKMEIRWELLMQPPQSLAEAMAKAQLYEERNDDMFQRQRREGYRQYEGQSRTPVTEHTGVRGHTSISSLGAPRPATLGKLKVATEATLAG